MGYDPVWKTLHCQKHADLADHPDCSCTCGSTFDTTYEDPSYANDCRDSTSSERCSTSDG